MVHGQEPVLKHDLSSLRILGSVGEPINAEAWRWFYEVVGRKQSPIVDTYWQSETGGVIISSLPGASHMKPGIATKPFFGVDARVVRPNGEECDADESGYLVINKPWPGMMRVRSKRAFAATSRCSALAEWRDKKSLLLLCPPY